MEIVLKFEAKDLQKMKDLLLKDNFVSRASIIFKDGSFVNKPGYYCYISGLEDQCKKAIALTNEMAKEAETKDRDEVIQKIKEEESRASEGLGGIFG